MLVVEHEQLETMERQMFEALRRRLQGAIAAKALEVKDPSAVNGCPALSLVTERTT